LTLQPSVTRLNQLQRSGKSLAELDRVTLRCLRAKARRISRILELAIGTPTQMARLPRPLDMLIATILSQNTNDKNSHRAYMQLRKKYPRWKDVASARLRDIRASIRVGGMANQKSARIKKTLEAVKDKFGGYDLSPLEEMKSSEVIEELTRIDGVGVKTASCVLLFSMGRDVFPVDTHVHRLCGRLGLARGCSTPEKTFLFMQNVFPKGRGYSFHTNLIRFGRKVCRSNKPACGLCPLYDECVFPGKTRSRGTRRASSKANHDFMLLDHVEVAH
jgi:endonuclease-3